MMFVVLAAHCCKHPPLTSFDKPKIVLGGFILVCNVSKPDFDNE